MEEGYQFDKAFTEYGKTDNVSVAKVTENGNYGTTQVCGFIRIAQSTPTL